MVFCYFTVSVEESIRFNAGCGPTAHPPSTCAGVIHALSMYIESGSAVHVAKKRLLRHFFQMSCHNCCTRRAVPASRALLAGERNKNNGPFGPRRMPMRLGHVKEFGIPTSGCRRSWKEGSGVPQIGWNAIFQTMHCDATFDLSVRSSLIVLRPF